MSGSSVKLWNALISAHHITSRKKVAKLKEAASSKNVFALLRSGAPPGIMYVEGYRQAVERWVKTVQVSRFMYDFSMCAQTCGTNAWRKRLRYKDYQLSCRPAEVKREFHVTGEARISVCTGLYETDSVRAFGQQMRERGVYAWWRTGMGYH